MKIVVWEQIDEETGARVFVAGHAERKIVAHGSTAKIAAGGFIAWLKESAKDGGVVPALDFVHTLAPYDPEYASDPLRIKDPSAYAAAIADPVAYLRSRPELAAQYEREGATDEEIRARLVVPKNVPLYPPADARVVAMFAGGEPMDHPRLPKKWDLRIWRGDDATLPPWPTPPAPPTVDAVEAEEA